MLKMIIGTAGSGKTEYIRSLVAEGIKSNMSGLVLLTPEQNSFENERELIRLVGASASGRVEVLTFSRLYDIVTRMCGGSACVVADDTTRLILMHRALKEIGPELSVYGRSTSVEFCMKILDTITELKQSAISADDLIKTSNLLNGKSLKSKIKDIALIELAYSALGSNVYIDDQDVLSILYEKLAGFEYFKGKTVFIDAFKGFTKQQYMILERIFAQADDVYITFCSDGINDSEYGTGLFSNVKSTIKDIVDIARKSGCKIAAPVILSDNLRFKNDDLISAHESYLTRKKFDGGENIKICPCDTPYEEAEFVAGCIKNLIRTKGYRYRDFTVIVRDFDAYGDLLSGAFERYGLPLFRDAKINIRSLPLIKFVIDAVSAAISGYDTQKMLTLIKSAIIGIGAEDASELENYVFVWNINKSQWMSEWTESPDGFHGKIDEEKLEKLNKIREFIITPLQKLRSALKSKNVKLICTAVYDLLIEFNVGKGLQAYANILKSDAEVQLASAQSESWDAVINVLDNIVKAYGESSLESREFFEILKFSLSTVEIGTIPSTNDEICVGAADKIRPAKPRITFIAGANHGEFPRFISSGGCFSAAERKALISGGLDIPDRTIHDAVEERFLVYSSVFSASEQVYISYHTRGNKGEISAPSEFVTLLCGESNIISREYIKGLKYESAVCAAQDCSYSEDLKVLIDKACRKDGYNVIDAISFPERKYSRSILAENAAGLFGKNLVLSPSKIEVYRKCAFSYFCKYGLKAAPLRKAEVDVLERGSIVHYVLEHMIKRHGKNISKLSSSQAEEEIAELIHGYADEFFGNALNKDKRLRIKLKSISSMILPLVLHIRDELAQSGFNPVACELLISNNGDEKPLNVPLKNGSSLAVTGIVDRVDEFVSGQTVYIRVIDYKTGHRNFEISDVLHGLNMQMLIYLFAIEESRSVKEQCRPAGILYQPSKRPVAESGSSDIDRKKQLRMNGLISSDEAVLDAMEPDGLGIYAPFSYTKKGLSSRSQCISDDDFKLLKSCVKGRLKDIGNDMLSGNISINPLDGCDGSACKYCDYRTVCGRSEDEENSSVEKLKISEAVEIIRAEVENNAD